jgi:hypothetical protein
MKIFYKMIHRLCWKLANKPYLDRSLLYKDAKDMKGMNDTRNVLEQENNFFIPNTRITLTDTLNNPFFIDEMKIYRHNKYAVNFIGYNGYLTLLTSGKKRQITAGMYKFHNEFHGMKIEYSFYNQLNIPLYSPMSRIEVLLDIKKLNSMITT